MTDKIRLLVDTNILVYALNQDSRYHDWSRSILNNQDYEIILTHKNVTEFVSVLSKHGNYEIIKIELPKIMERFHILYPDKLSMDMFAFLIEKYQPTGNRVYDFEIISVMLANDLKLLATVNVDDFKAVKEISLLSLQ
jgi:predicted nucleic acid-binding protein